MRTKIDVTVTQTAKVTMKYGRKESGFTKFGVTPGGGRSPPVGREPRSIGFNQCDRMINEIFFSCSDSFSEARFVLFLRPSSFRRNGREIS